MGYCYLVEATQQRLQPYGFLGVSLLGSAILLSPAGRIGDQPSISQDVLGLRRPVSGGFLSIFRKDQSQELRGRVDKRNMVSSIHIRHGSHTQSSCVSAMLLKKRVDCGRSRHTDEPVNRPSETFLRLPFEALERYSKASSRRSTSGLSGPSENSRPGRAHPSPQNGP